MKRRILSVFLLISLVISCLPTASAYSNVSDWAQEAVESMDALGFLPQSVANGDMGKTITRGELCKIAVAVYKQLIGTPEVGPDSTDHFEDTTDPDICFAYEQGIINGYGNGKFGPNDPLTRQDFMKITFFMMATAYWYPDGVTPDSLERFSDRDQISDYAVNSAAYLVALGIVQGDGSRLHPLDHITREEAVTLFFRTYQYMEGWILEQDEENRTIYIYNQGYTGISTWAIQEIVEMQENGMIPSCLDNCNMSHSITRAQMCSIAVLAYSKANGAAYTPNSTQHFTDTSDPDVSAAYELGIVSGYGDGRFGPDDPLTREQFFKIMANFMKALGYSRQDATSVALSVYNDGRQVSSWAQASTRLMIYIGAVRGDGKNLNPQNDTSIEEAIAVFLRCYKYTLAWQESNGGNEEELDEYTQTINDLLAFACSFEGYPYVYGGAGPNSFDCSGFVMYVYKHFGYSLPHGATSQYRSSQCTHVGYSELLPGDLVFFSNNGGSTMFHVGLYLGDSTFIHAANPSRGVVIEKLTSNYYYTRFYSGGRIIHN